MIGELDYEDTLEPENEPHVCDGCLRRHAGRAALCARCDGARDEADILRAALRGEAGREGE